MVILFLANPDLMSMLIYSRSLTRYEYTCQKWIAQKATSLIKEVFYFPFCFRKFLYFSSSPDKEYVNNLLTKAP